MRYFKNNQGKVFAYDDEQIKQGLAKDKTEITESEKDELTYVAPTDEELQSQLKKDGIIYPGTDYKVPLDNAAALLMMQVKNAFEMGITFTNIKFDNGTVMPIQVAKFQDFAMWFVTERNKFFV